MPNTPHDLPLPQALIDLIESGFWPLTDQQSNAQRSRCLVSLDRIQSFAPDESYIFFYRPPFSTEEAHLKNIQSSWDNPMWATHQIDPALTLILGDFGVGSDAAFALDYRANRDDPTVIRLQWNLGADNHWVKVAPPFAEFAAMLFD